jgi:hypothetical protein
MAGRGVEMIEARNRVKTNKRRVKKRKKWEHRWKDELKLLYLRWNNDGKALVSITGKRKRGN